MEMVVILMIAVLLFGANKIPKLARSTGQAMGEFQKGRQQVEQELEQMEDAMDPEAEFSEDDDTEYMDLDEDSTTTETTADTASTETTTETTSESTSDESSN
jgi:sec-independent protein translocase protein TatA